MKHKIILTLAAITMALPLHARTWTSADGKNNFDGDYVSSTESTVTVIKNGQKRTFKMNLLSAEDQSWIKENGKRIEEEAREKAAKGSIDDQKIGKKLQGKTVRVVGGKFIQRDTTKVPEYYLLYFTASW